MEQLIMDRKGKKLNLQEGKFPRAFFELVKQESTEDIWRKLNPKVKDYTFYSARHQSFF